MEENLVSTPPRVHSLSSPFSSSTEVSEPDYSKTSPKSSAAKAPPPSITRLWRPAAQRNLRNQWSNLASYRQKWDSSSSIARSHATSLVNAFLSQRYMNARELGVLSDMPDIRKKACCKLFKQQELLQRKLLSSYKDLFLFLGVGVLEVHCQEFIYSQLYTYQQVAVVTHMIDTSRSMRCFLKGTNSSPLVQFSNCSREENDTGDGGGIVIFTFWSVSFFEELAQELVQMFAAELNLKRLIVVELLSISCEEVPQINELCWSDELYPGEFDDLCLCNLYSKDACEPVLPRLKGWNSDIPTLQTKRQSDHDVLQVYLTSWLAEVNIDIHRVNDIFGLVSEEMHVNLS